MGDWEWIDADELSDLAEGTMVLTILGEGDLPEEHYVEDDDGFASNTEAIEAAEELCAADGRSGRIWLVVDEAPPRQIAIITPSTPS